MSPSLKNPYGTVMIVKIAKMSGAAGETEA